MSNDDPLAFFITWNTYGTWLPGDDRGWVEYHGGWQLPDPMLELECAARMTEEACRLSPRERAGVEEQIAETRAIRKWTLHAVNCRSNHLHVVVTAPVKPKIVRAQLKAWCTRRLKAMAAKQGEPLREQWWAERGSIRWINGHPALEAAILYTRDGQDKPACVRAYKP